MFYRWDEWVPECRILKHNEKNLAQQKDLNKYQKSFPAKCGKKNGKGGKLKIGDGKSDGDDADSRYSCNFVLFEYTPAQCSWDKKKGVGVHEETHIATFYY